MTPPRVRGGVVAFPGGDTPMSDRHRDPLELWVGTWTPEEWIQRENRKREKESSSGAATSEPPSPETQAKAE
jgi:hypothetical protein